MTMDLAAALDAACREALAKRRDQIESLVAAIVEHGGQRPSALEIVETHEGTSIAWHVRLRPGTAPYLSELERVTSERDSARILHEQSREANARLVGRMQEVRRLRDELERDPWGRIPVVARLDAILGGS